MPIYEYRCTSCEQIFEEWQKNFEETQVNCPVCGGDSARVMSNTSFVLKGGGWYVSEYGRNSASSKTDQGTTTSTTTEGAGTSSGPGSSSASGTADAVASGGSAS